MLLDLRRFRQFQLDCPALKNGSLSLTQLSWTTFAFRDRIHLVGAGNATVSERLRDPLRLHVTIMIKRRILRISIRAWRTLIAAYQLLLLLRIGEYFICVYSMRLFEAMHSDRKGIIHFRTGRVLFTRDSTSNGFCESSQRVTYCTSI